MGKRKSNLGRKSKIAKYASKSRDSKDCGSKGNSPDDILIPPSQQLNFVEHFAESVLQKALDLITPLIELENSSSNLQLDVTSDLLTVLMTPEQIEIVNNFVNDCKLAVPARLENNNYEVVCKGKGVISGFVCPKITADGNCFYESLSIYLSHSTRYKSALRLVVLKKSS